MTGGAPLARGGTAAGGTEETRGGDIPTTGMVPIGTGATAGSGGMLAKPPTPAEEEGHSHRAVQHAGLLSSPRRSRHARGHSRGRDQTL